MDTQQFLDYLNEHTVTRDLAAEVADLLATRRNRRRVVATDEVAEARTRRIAS